MIITTCETIPGKELEYLGLVSAASIGGLAGNQKAMNKAAGKLAGNLEAGLAEAGAERGADAVIGVKFVFEQSTNVAFGTAVKFK